ncbi:MAG: GH1 family beta-glucosidase [Gemmiger sp.]|nr:GH1 family beta-glucosidase [Gemmiger sp.]
MAFPKGFVWGGASAAYQIEGAAAEDGRAPSIWDVFCEQPGRILDGQSGAVACDHYHRAPEDVALMQRCGYKGYRFSTAWPRILPEGFGRVNEKGLDFYDRLVDDLLAHGIEPYLTLYHWDLPALLQQRGGWLNPDSPQWFAEYAAVVARRLGDRVKHFFTFNEPQCFIGNCYVNTDHAPGLAYPQRDVLQMMHHVLLGHGLAVQALRATVPGAGVGFVPTGSANYPVAETPENIEAARSAFFAVHDNWAWSIGAWCDPVLLGSYPPAFVERFGSEMPAHWQDDLKTICQPLDFLGLNCYNGHPVESDGAGGYRFSPRKVGYDRTAVKWPITPKALYWGPRFLYERYKKPIYISENGLSCADVISLDGKVHDPNRIDFLHRYLLELKRAAGDGVDVRGYFHWCVTDNFEWNRGYAERFGMIYCDFETQQRILKDSAYWFAEVARTNGENL